MSLPHSQVSQDQLMSQKYKQMVSPFNRSLVGGLEHEFYDFPYIGNNHPNWLSYVSEG